MSWYHITRSRLFCYFLNCIYISELTSGTTLPCLYMGGQKSVLWIYIIPTWCHVKYLGSSVNAYNNINLEGLMLCSCVHQFNAFPELITAPRGEGFSFVTQTIFSPISSDQKRSSVKVGAHHRFPVNNLVSCLVCWYCSCLHTASTHCLFCWWIAFGCFG